MTKGCLSFVINGCMPARLQEIFYTFKNETLDEITDDELLEFMREQYEEKCCGDTEYLEGTFLSDFAQAIRSGKEVTESEI